jgi:hypothetical protein
LELNLNNAEVPRSIFYNLHYSIVIKKLLEAEELNVPSLIARWLLAGILQLAWQKTNKTPVLPFCLYCNAFFVTWILRICYLRK